MDLSIIIVSWKVKERLRQNLQAIFQSTGWRWQTGQAGYRAEVLVVDNNSQDGTVEMIKQDFPAVKLIANTENLGFAKAVNQAWRDAQGRIVLLLNPDMRVESQTLQQLVQWLDSHPSVAAASCCLLDEQGQPLQHVRRFPQLSDQLAIIFKLPHLFSKILNRYLRADFDYASTARVETVRGSFLAVKKETWQQVGLLDERYFIWFEDVDYCRSLQKHNLELWYLGSIVCHDAVGQSFKQVATLTTQKYFRQSMLQYFAKWQPAWQVMVLHLAWLKIWPVMWLVNRLGLKGKIKT